jgi:colanic acid biosynthesis glycosyl transferase WcaI
VGLRLLIHGINYAPELVGIGRYTGELGAWLGSRGHQVTVLTGPPYYPAWRVPAAYRRRPWRREWLAGVEVLRAPLYVPARVTGKGRVLHEISFGAGCLGWWPRLWAQPWDAVMAVCPLLQSGLIPALLSRRRHLPFILHVQDLQVDAARDLGIIRQPLLLGLMERLEGWLFSRAAAVTTISQAMAARIRDKGANPARVHLLPNWADLESIRPGPGRQAMRRELGLDREILVLYAGNMGEKQGLELILAAAAGHHHRSDIRYILAGEGAARTRLRQQARDLGLNRVDFLPLQDQQRFPALLAAADIHLIVQKSRASDLVMPSKLANILAAGGPFIATARPDTEVGRITRQSGAGVLVPPEDAEALGRAILKLAGDKPTRKKMADKARKFAEARLGRDKILLDWESLFYSLVNEADLGKQWEEKCR